MKTVWLWVAVVICAAAVAGAQTPTPDTARVQRALGLLVGVGGEYREAFDEQGQLVLPRDIDETKLLLVEVRSLMAPMAAIDGELENLLTKLQSLVELQVPPPVVSAYAEVVRRYLIHVTGVREEIVPPERPSLARGRELFAENCAGCHGATGAGDGADAIRLNLKPPNFTDPAFMRAETPRDAFNVITLGRQKSGMPAWGESLSAQQVWDLVSYLWSLGRGAASVRSGQQTYAAQCAGCHGTAGDPANGKATGFARPPVSLASLVDSAERSDASTFALVSDGSRNQAMPGFASSLSEDERWAVVDFVRALSLEGTPGTSDQPMEPDRVAELQEVRRLVESALNAHRRRDPSANSLATDAYLRLEPLEKPLSERNEAAMEALEGAFIAFRSALRNPAAGNAEELGQQIIGELTNAAEVLRPASAPSPPRSSLWARGVLAVATGLVLFVAGVWLRARRAGASPSASR